MDLVSQIDMERLPKHIAVIMDGNGRWAKNKNMPRIFGHKNGVEAVRQVTENSARLGVEHLTVFAFSTENWERPKLEVTGLMSLLVETIHGELKTLQKNEIRLNAIGDLNALPDRTQRALAKAIEDTAGNNRMTLHLALNYSGKWDILQAVERYKRESDSSNLEFEQFLSTAGIPDPELLIRTSGELRISNFFLWQLAYTELYFTDVFWPDFRKEHLYSAIIEFQSRDRRFGKLK